MILYVPLPTYIHSFCPRERESIIAFGDRRWRLELTGGEFMESHTSFWIAVLLAAGLLLLSVVAYGVTPPPPTPIPPAPAAPEPKRPPPPPTPTEEERRIQTPTDFGTNTRVVDGDIHVWHAPTCPPVPPAAWVASIILTDLRSGSHLYLNRDGSSPAPDYRSDGRSGTIRRGAGG